MHPFMRMLLLVLLSLLVLGSAELRAGKPIPVNGIVTHNGRGDRVTLRSWMKSLQGRTVYSEKRVVSKGGLLRSLKQWKTPAGRELRERLKTAAAAERLRNARRSR